MTSRFLLVFAALAVACSSGGGDPITAPDAGTDASKDTASTDDTSAIDDTGSAADTSAPTDDGCAAPRMYCGSDCFDVQTSAAHCGMCFAACADKETCVAGKCVAPCPAGHTRCGSACVNTASDPAHCGACDKACAGMENCNAGTCSLSCDFPNKACGGKCVNIQFDANHCGDCDKVCPSGAKGTGNCTSGSCVLTCESGFGNCDDNASNGCEVNLASTDAHCGGCFKACSATETCLASKCECKTGTARCGAACVDLTSSDTNCGVCGKTCAATETCASSTCECKSGLSRCGTACVDTKTDAANCGMCGTACGAGNTCSDGKCCPTGQLNCGGTCVDPTRDPAHCGMCSAACSGGTPYCVASACAATCGAGTVPCSGACVDTATDRNHCGMCGKACLSTEVCSESACVAAGFPGSTIVDAAQGVSINTMIGTPGQLWKLCYTKATSPSTAAAFHAGCDGKGAAVMLAKLTTGATVKIIGGFTNVGWSSVSGYKTDPLATLFSVTNDFKHGLKLATGANATYHSASYGPAFGNGYDFYISSNMNTGYCYLGTAYNCRTGLTSTACHNDFCGSYNGWTATSFEVWVK